MRSQFWCAVLTLVLVFSIGAKQVQASWLDNLNLPFLPKSAQKIVTDSTKLLSKVRTAHIDMEGEMRLKDINGSFLRGDGLIKITRSSDVNFEQKIQKSHAAMSIGDQTLDMDLVLLTDGKIYFKVPSVGEAWFEANIHQSDPSEIPLNAESDYSQQLSDIIKAINEDSIKKIGYEELDGVKVAKFDVDIVKDQLMKAVKDSTNNEMLAQMYKDATVKTSFWINESNNQIIKAEAKINNLALIDTNSRSGQDLGSADALIRFKYSRINEPIDIQKPEGRIIPLEIVNSNQNTI